MPLLLLVGFIAAMMWAKASDPFTRVEFSLKMASGSRVNCIAILPKPVGKHPVVIYLQGSGGSLLGTGNELRQVAELGLAAVGLQYCQTNQEVFDEQFIALHQFLQKQSWAQSNATALVGFSLGAQRTLSFALRHPELQPQLLVRRAGGWIPELDGNEHQAKPLTPSLSPSDGERVSARTGEGVRPSTTNLHLSSFILHPLPTIRCPVLLIHGERDEVFPVADCKRLAELLRSNGTPVEVRIFPESGHGFVEDRGPVVRAVAEYCAARLPLTDYTAAVPGCRLTPAEAQRFNLAMRRAGQHRRELWRAVTTSREPERHTVMNLIGGLEDYDLAHISAAQLRESVDRAWQARRKYPWCRDVPLEIFEKFVANPRTYEEPLEQASFPFVRRPLPRVKYCHTTADAGEALWAWLSRRLRFRTEPFTQEATPRERLNQMGWCVEGVTIYNYFGRSVGLPMRPAYTIWPTVGSSHVTHWWSEIWSVEENQWHAVDSSDYERTYGSFWMLRVPKATILSTTSERGGWNAIGEQRWEAFTNTVSLFYPSGQVVVRVLDREQPVSGQRVMAQTWLGKAVASVAAARTDEHGEARLSLGQSARHPYRILIDGPGETDWQWLTVQSNQTYTVTLHLEEAMPFDPATAPPAPDFSENGETR